MTGQSRSVDAILSDRLRATQDIALANMEHLRLNQQAGGLMILDQKDEEDGIVNREREAETARNRAALQQNMEHLVRLEGRLAALDEELEAAISKEN